MDETELLRTIRPIWIHRTTLSLAKGAGLREDLRAQLERFFDLLEQVVEHRRPGLAGFDPVGLVHLADPNRPGKRPEQHDALHQRNHGANVPGVPRRPWPAKGAGSDVGPDARLAYAFEKAAFFEMQVRVAYVSNQLKQVQPTLERLDRSKSDFIAVAAHELKTPLTLIEGYTAMLRESRDHSGMTAVGRRTAPGDQQRHAPPENHHRRYDRCVADRQQPDAAQLPAGMDQPPAERAQGQSWKPAAKERVADLRNPAISLAATK